MSRPVTIGKSPTGKCLNLVDAMQRDVIKKMVERLRDIKLIKCRFVVVTNCNPPQ